MIKLKQQKQDLNIYKITQQQQFFLEFGFKSGSSSKFDLIILYDKFSILHKKNKYIKV